AEPAAPGFDCRRRPDGRLLLSRAPHQPAIVRPGTHGGAAMKAGAVAVAVLGMLAVTPAAAALTVFPMEHTCPLGGVRFARDTVMSGTAFGHDLGGRRLGPIAQPWPLVECPGNGFPIPRHDFSKAEVGQLAPLIASDAYQ